MKSILAIALLCAPAFTLSVRQETQEINDKVYGVGLGHCKAKGKGHELAKGDGHHKLRSGCTDNVATDPYYAEGTEYQAPVDTNQYEVVDEPAAYEVVDEPAAYEVVDEPEEPVAYIDATAYDEGMEAEAAY